MMNNITTAEGIIVDQTMLAGSIDSGYCVTADPSTGGFAVCLYEHGAWYWLVNRESLLAANMPGNTDLDMTDAQILAAHTVATGEDL